LIFKRLIVLQLATLNHTDLRHPGVTHRQNGLAEFLRLFA
jgi:hypothetical protein